ncbi:hypothetical protein CEXT_451581 [Caerostris extrusa]|uniref:Ribosomal protein S14 n=1 Tax=Caerostris extrusa TaxID=172846 RepID=A0AAV4RYK8_CAEEX|nr:hypothetical protein CEXT_451581 [Caerostris extrusa]
MKRRSKVRILKENYKKKMAEKEKIVRAEISRISSKSRNVMCFKHYSASRKKRSSTSPSGVLVPSLSPQHQHHPERNTDCDFAEASVSKELS